MDLAGENTCNPKALRSCRIVLTPSEGGYSATELCRLHRRLQPALVARIERFTVNRAT